MSKCRLLKLALAAGFVAASMGANGASVPVTSVTTSTTGTGEIELKSLTVGSTTYTRAQLGNGTLTDYGNQNAIVLVTQEGLTAAQVNAIPDKQRFLQDWYLNTGVINIGQTTNTATFSFTDAVINNTGADIFFFALSPSTDDVFSITIGGTTKSYPTTGSSWSGSLVSLFGSSSTSDNYDLWSTGSTVTSIDTLNSAIYAANSADSGDRYIAGLGIDLADFFPSLAIGSSAPVTMTIASTTSTTGGFDPVLITATVVPLPPAVLLFGTALLGITYLGRRRLQA